MKIVPSSTKSMIVKKTWLKSEELKRNEKVKTAKISKGSGLKKSPIKMSGQSKITCFLEQKSMAFGVPFQISSTKNKIEDNTSIDILKNTTADLVQSTGGTKKTEARNELQHCAKQLQGGNSI